VVPVQRAFDATLGERCYVAFIAGNILKPVIINFCQHPNQAKELESPEGLKPQGVLQYKGVRVDIDDKGQIRFIHKGAPNIVYNITDVQPSLIPSAIGGSKAPAIIPQDDENVTLWEFLDGGVFRIRDSLGQIIEINRTIDDGRIYISNNDLKSTDNPDAGPLSGGLQWLTNSTDAEYIWLDRKKQMVLINARQIIQLYSFDRRKDVTDGDHSHKVGGSNSWIIGSDESIVIGGGRSHIIKGNDELTVGGAIKHMVKGAYDGKFGDDWKVLAPKGEVSMTASGLATLKLSGGKVGLGNKTAEIIDLFSQALGLLIDNAPTLTQTSAGPGALDPKVVIKAAKLKALADSIKGGV
jgi:hypothetical protein